ncbi:uncharacterized protein PAF06_007149 [Gastrophryne carolinensis]
MEEQSPYVSSSHSPGEEPEEQPYRAHGKPYDEDLDDVLDLTGGHYNHPPFSVTFPAKKEEDDKAGYADSLEPSPEEEEPSSIGSDAPTPPPPAPLIPSAPVEEHDTTPAPYGGAPSSGSVDVNLFPLPSASAPLMLSYAGKSFLLYSAAELTPTLSWSLF